MSFRIQLSQVDVGTEDMTNIGVLRGLAIHKRAVGYSYMVTLNPTNYKLVSLGCLINIEKS